MLWRGATLAERVGKTVKPKQLSKPFACCCAERQHHRATAEGGLCPLRWLEHGGGHTGCRKIPSCWEVSPLWRAGCLTVWAVCCSFVWWCCCCFCCCFLEGGLAGLSEVYLLLINYCMWFCENKNGVGMGCMLLSFVWGGGGGGGSSLIFFYLFPAVFLGTEGGSDDGSFSDLINFILSGNSEVAFICVFLAGGAPLKKKILSGFMNKIQRRVSE